MKRLEPSPLFFLLSLVGATIVAVAASFVAGVEPPPVWVNVAFFAAFGAACAAYRSPSRSYRAAFMAGFLLYAVVLIAALVVESLDEKAFFAEPLVRPFAIIGVWPRGPDAWLPITVCFWSATTLPLLILSLGLGRMARSLLSRRSEP